MRKQSKRENTIAHYKTSTSADHKETVVGKIGCLVVSVAEVSKSMNSTVNQIIKQ